MNDANWFRIGLENYHRQEYSMLITRLRGMFHDAIFFVSFDINGDICIASDNLNATATIDLEYVLYEMTGKTLNEYQASEPFFNLN